MATRKLTLSAVLAALALGLSLLERLIVLPVPGMKLGLANLVTVFALYLLGLPYAAVILLTRILLGSIFGGSVTALAYALAGGALSLCTMTLAKRNPHLSVFGVSVLGAATHSIGQILAAAALLGSGAVFAYLPVLLIVSVGTGLLIGLLSAGILKVVPAALPKL